MADVRAENIEQRGSAGSTFECRAETAGNGRTCTWSGDHNIYNALAAIAVGLERGLSLSEGAPSLATLAPADKRGRSSKLGNITIINDCYNSNPTALDAMVDALAAMPGEAKNRGRG